uniref:uncharacterized protein LOC122608205 n=1 Tax=Erigeron canadensis TaxID=72917 RepID=UPI001CB8B1D2|nr:uncharacterized protein LOC122608205 [Erigeron canadensis]
MDDTHLVVNLLVKLRHQSNSSSSVTSASHNLQRWSTRQRRTKQQNVLISTNGDKTPPPRASPTTPLSSYSSDGGGGGGGCTEESSLPNLDRGGISRSKVIIGPNKTTPTKRPRKKRTLAELKEDETTLLKERKQLKRQLATLQATCQKQREENASLKKMKNDLQSKELVVPEVKDCMEGKEARGFVLPDLNFPAGEDDC